MTPPWPVSPDVNPITLGTEEDEESMDGGSDLGDAEDVFVGEEPELPKTTRCETRPSEEGVKYTTEHIYPIVLAVPLAWQLDSLTCSTALLMRMNGLFR